MTNRKDLLDEAILRPGRLEVHVEIGLPDEAGRVQILKACSWVLEKGLGVGEGGRLIGLFSSILASCAALPFLPAVSFDGRGGGTQLGSLIITHRALWLQIHTAELEKNGRLGADVNIEQLAKMTRNYTGAELRGVIRAAKVG